jgi:NADH-quinone oxidoreductase subunit H
MNALITLLFFPGGLFVLGLGLAYEWVERKLMARLQNRVGPRWFQPWADIAKLLVKEEIVPTGVDARLFLGLPLVALAGALTSVLYVPMAGLAPSYSFAGDLIVTLYFLSLLTLCLGLAGANGVDRFSLVGATRTLTQLFSYEAPFLLALLAPALLAGSWQISWIAGYEAQQWLIVTQPIGFAVAIVGLMGKLERPPFDAPEAPTEIVAGVLTEYGGRGLALFRLARTVELIVGLTLISAFYLGGVLSPVDFFLKTLLLLFIMSTVQSVFARLRIDQTVSIWWRFGILLVLAQLLLTFIWKAGSV